MIEILTTGAGNTVQDLGRPGLLALGISSGGAMDRLALRLGNLLLGNPENTASLEIVLFPFRLRVEEDVWLSITGADCGATLDDRALSPMWAVHAKAGETLKLNPPTRGARAYISFAGGIDVPLAIGSRSTDLKTGFGGIEGRGLGRGDRLQLSSVAHPEPRDQGIYFPIAMPGRNEATAIRVVAGAEHGAFTNDSQATFLGEEWLVSPDSNRMGMRLKGSELSLEQPLEMLSHGILPGTIQVPPSGQPIVQLADANTCGGYPKVAHVIDADLWRFAQLPIGGKVQFKIVTEQEALAEERRLEGWISKIQCNLGILAKCN